jgi:hypothetical protein
MTDESKEKVLGRDDILNADDIDILSVDVPEWGGAVLLRKLTSEDRGKIEYWCQLHTDTDAVGELYARMVIACAVNEAGARLFKWEDLKGILSKSGDAVFRVGLAAIKFNKISRSDMEDVVKKS